ncbi:Anaphase-promoting complex subunit 6 [Morus notabilis]|uniref:Anaphase-promoting complex subunit 6 n=1 Tax=Morus notabilis TaxID=981085 RepID=W9QE15_9ROSA|nr:Anaphase-promoting complex subunit 6 [Morus notabilis]
MREEEIEKLRGVVRDCVSKHLYSSAIFFADKVAAFTNDPADIYMQAQALFLGRHYRRAYHLLNASQIVLRDLRFRYLAAKCLEELKEWDQCLLMLGDAKVDEHGNVYDTKDCNAMYLDKYGEDREINYDKEYVVEAKFRELEKESCNSNPSDLSFMRNLKSNTDLLACKAEYYHQCGEYQKCFELTSILLEKDPFHLKSTLVHLAAAMELGQSNELYLMACNLVKDYPQNKATSLDGTFPPAWIGYGNAFAAQEEGDQAMSAYRTAARLFPGSWNVRFDKAIKSYGFDQNQDVSNERKEDVLILYKPEYLIFSGSGQSLSVELKIRSLGSRVVHP